MAYRKVSLKLAATAASVIMILTASVAPLSLFWINDTRSERNVVQQQIESLRIVQELLVDAETGQRGYVITGNEVFLRPYYVSLTSLPFELKKLKAAYVGDLADQVKKSDDLIGYAHLKLNDLAKTIKLRHEQGYAAVEPVISSGRGKDLMDNIRDSTGELIFGEQQELAVLDRELTKKGIAAVGFSLASTLLTMLLLSFMFRSMRKAMQAQDASAGQLKLFSKQLEESIQELSQRNFEISLLGEMSRTLQTEMSLSEGLAISSHYCAKLLPGTTGAIFLYRNSADMLEQNAVWGAEEAGPRMMAPNDCWALRRGQVHRCEEDHSALHCNHYTGESGCNQYCFPLTAYGEVLGLLYITTPKQSGVLTEREMDLAAAICEQAALALSNARLRQVLRDQSVKDALTGLYNRRFMEESLTRELARSQRNGSPVSLIMLDIDHFKQVNDLHGHAAGDAALRMTAQLLKKTLRASDLACRYGGEELVMLLPDCSKDNAVARAQQLCDALRQLTTVEGGHSISVTASFGVATSPDDSTDLAGLVSRADGAMYAAKRAGRDRIMAA
jgi:diguanylate cyclase (GGDEF)-like protein